MTTALIIAAAFLLLVGFIAGALWQKRRIFWLVAGAYWDREEARDQRNEALAQRDIVISENTLLRYHLDPTEKVLMPRTVTRGQA